jgi:ABC-2 type transport system ATP-binding protein
MELQEKLRGQPGVDQTVMFGGDLHVSGKDAESLERSVRTIIAGTTLRAEKIETALEDVFIYMMSQAADNVGGKS